MKDVWTFLFDQGWAWSLLKGSGVTLGLGLLGMSLGLIIALPLAIIRWREVYVLNHLVEAYTLLVRSIPGLLIIYLIFFGSVQAVDAIGAFFGFQAAVRGAYPFLMGMLAISIISSAYSVEVLRGALQTIPEGLIEASKSLAMPRRGIYLRIVLPLMVRNALSGINNVWQMTIKDTSLVSVVGLGELMRTAALAAGISRSPLVFYLIAGCVFLLITWVSQRLFVVCERRLNRGFLRAR
jgi:octopine/nopaline transport system permease protein